MTRLNDIEDVFDYAFLLKDLKKHFVFSTFHLDKSSLRRSWNKQNETRNIQGHITKSFNFKHVILMVEIATEFPLVKNR